MSRLIILDRDGVINEDSDAFIKTPDEFIPIPGSLEAIVRLNAAGYTVAVATNQSGIARGLFDKSVLDAIHDKLNALLAAMGGRVDAITYCPHGPNDCCDCRKPSPGLMYQVAGITGLALENAWVVGDSARDLQAGDAVQSYPALVRTGKGLRTLASGELRSGIPVFDNLAAVVDALLSGSAANEYTP